MILEAFFSRCAHRSFMAAIAIVSFATGCASLPPVRTAPDIAKKREAREAEIVRSYEEKRDQATYEAALARFNHGDEKGALEATGGLLARSPRHRDARLLRADIYLMRGDHEAARRELETLFEFDPNDAIALHSMGLLLESAGRTDEAREYYARAMKEEPHNEAFAMSYKSLDETVSTPRDRRTSRRAGADEVAPGDRAVVPASAVMPDRKSSANGRNENPGFARHAHANDGSAESFLPPKKNLFDGFRTAPAHEPTPFGKRPREIESLDDDPLIKTTDKLLGDMPRPPVPYMANRKVLPASAEIDVRPAVESPSAGPPCEIICTDMEGDECAEDEKYIGPSPVAVWPPYEKPGAISSIRKQPSGDLSSSRRPSAHSAAPEHRAERAAAPASHEEQADDLSSEPAADYWSE